MFTFKDSNFYLNQVCVPYCVCTEGLHDGSFVDVDHENKVLHSAANGEYILIGERLNRALAMPEANGYSVYVNESFHLPGTCARAYRVENLLGVEFYASLQEDGVSPMTTTKVEAGNVLFDNGTFEFEVVEVRGNIATVVCKRKVADE